MPRRVLIHHSKFIIQNFPLQTIHIYTDSELTEIQNMAAQGCTMASIAQSLGVKKSSFFRDYNNLATGVKDAYDTGLNEAITNNASLLEEQTEGKQAVKAIMALRGDILATKIQNTMDEIDYQRSHEEL